MFPEEICVYLSLYAQLTELVSDLGAIMCCVHFFPLLIYT